MCLLDEIYQVFSENEGVTKKSIEVNNEILAIAKNADMEAMIEDKEYLPTLLFNAAYLGEIEGFAIGLKYGIQLMIKCFE